MLKDHIQDIRAGIKAGRFTNEAAVSQGIVLRLLNALAWPSYNTQIVFPEYPLTGRRVDFALCHPPGNPVVFIEVKPLGQSDTGERQLFEYAFHKGVPMAILTDGHEWHFFLPAEQGDYGERRVYKLDLIERDIGEIAYRLQRYPHYDAICSGAAVEAARADYKDVARERRIQETLPKAWVKLIEEQDELLMEMVAERVESLCGYKPDPDTVADFLSHVVLKRLTDATLTPRETLPRKTTLAPPVTPPGLPPDAVPEIGFNLDGRWHSAKNGRDLLVNVFRRLAERDATFLERFASLPRHGRKRRYLARTPEELYPQRPDLARDHSYELGGGWWVGVNISKNSIEKIIKMACGVAGLNYGADINVRLGT